MSLRDIADRADRGRALTDPMIGPARRAPRQGADGGEPE
jgi:hypothetical protein